MPAETLTAEQLRSAFAAKGISPQELVALSGAHTVPPVCSHRARCHCLCRQHFQRPEDTEVQCYYIARSFWIWHVGYSD